MCPIYSLTNCTCSSTGNKDVSLNLRPQIQLTCTQPSQKGLLLGGLFVWHCKYYSFYNLYHFMWFFCKYFLVTQIKRLTHITLYFSLKPKNESTHVDVVSIFQVILLESNWWLTLLLNCAFCVQRFNAKHLRLRLVSEKRDRTTVELKLGFIWYL